VKRARRDANKKLVNDKSTPATTKLIRGAARVRRTWL
jgi:hypothetical protein